MGNTIDVIISTPVTTSHLKNKGISFHHIPPARKQRRLFRFYVPFSHPYCIRIFFRNHCTRIIISIYPITWVMVHFIKLIQNIILNLYLNPNTLQPNLNSTQIELINFLRWTHNDVVIIIHIIILFIYFYVGDSGWTLYLILTLKDHLSYGLITHCLLRILIIVHIL